MKKSTSVEDVAKDAALCYGCGTCTSSCPIARVNNDFDPRMILRRLVLGLADPSRDGDIWLCSACYTCQERCPQGIHITDLITGLRNVACKVGSIPQAVRIQLESIKGAGRTYVLDEFDLKKREKAGLYGIPLRIEEIVNLLEESW